MRLRTSRQTWDSLLITVLAFITALVISAIIIAIADDRTRSAAGYFFQYPQDTFTYAGQAIGTPTVRCSRGRSSIPAPPGTAPPAPSGRSRRR